MSELCLTILCPPAFSEQVLDTLLIMPEISLFTSSATFAHGLQHSALSATEQVLGMARMTQVAALLSPADLEHVLAHLRGELSGTGLKYWISPVIDAGEFS
jgi:hypothetical protein